MSTDDLSGELEAQDIAAHPQLKTSTSVFRHKSFRWFFIAAAISNGAAWMQMVAIPALLFDLTGQATWLGFSSLIGSLPAVLLTPHAGVIADRFSRKKMLLMTQSVQMTASFSLFILYSVDQLTPWRIVGIGFLNGIATGYGASTWQAFVPSLVPEEDMLSAVRLNSVQFTVARMIGPGLAGIVISTFGTGAAILCNASTYILVIGVLLVVKTRVGSTASRDLTVKQAMINGATYMWRHLPLRMAVILAFISSAFGQSLQFVSAAVSARVFHHPSTDNAGLMTALGVGSTLASIYATKSVGRFKRSQTVMTSLVFYCISTAMIAASSIYWIGLLGYFISGMAHLTMAVALNTLIQGLVPDRMRGRAMSFYLLGVMGGIPMGSFAIGFFGDMFSVRSVIVVDSCVYLAIILFFRSTKLLDQLNITSLED